MNHVLVDVVPACKVGVGQTILHPGAENKNTANRTAYEVVESTTEGLLARQQDGPREWLMIPASRLATVVRPVQPQRYRTVFYTMGMY